MEKVSVEVSILKNKVVGRVTAIRLRGGVDGCGGSVGPGDCQLGSVSYRGGVGLL